MTMTAHPTGKAIDSPERLVVSFRNAVRLKTAGFPQDTAEHFWWICEPRSHSFVGHRMRSRPTDLAAPTAQELMELMPPYLLLKRSSFGPGVRWIMLIMPGHVGVPMEAYHKLHGRLIEHRRAADAVAEWYLYLSRKNLLPLQA